MGANAQTSVPLFVANSVLTAAQQNISAATGVPVFATTVTRDAAFGGSNKALAEGQLAYIEASNIVQYYDGAAWATVGPTTSKIAQVVQATSTTEVTTTSTSFVTSGLAVTITPTLATSSILVMCNTNARNSSTTYISVWTLFRGTVAGTNLGNGAAGMLNLYSSAATVLYAGIALHYLDSPGTTSATTYTLGMNTNNATNTVYSQQSGATASIIAMEVLA